MFCPKCGTQNSIEQKYCRACGHQLAAHIAALEGRVDDVSTHLNKGSQLIAIGLIVVGIAKLNILLNFFLGAGKFGVILNLLILLFIAVPLISLGLVRLSQARRTLTPKGKPDNKAIAEAGITQLTAAADTDRSISIPSVTERTTLELKEPERERR
jgi:Zn ribbon nucleic-acid-binding protein